jgi:small subunit ribosomal protein S17e
MGRIKTSFVKHVGRDIFERHANEFTTDFHKNKEIINKYAFFVSKRMKNIVAGYITAMKKQQQKAS